MNIYNFICEEEVSLVPPKQYKFCKHHNYYHDSSSCISCSIEESHKNILKKIPIIG